MSRKRILVWLRRALRVEDNVPLWHAANEADEVIPLVCLRDEPQYHHESPRRLFVWNTLIDLDANLRSRGARLYVIWGKPEDAIPAAALTFGAVSVYVSRAYDAPTVTRDGLIARALESSGVGWESFKNAVIFEGAEIQTSGGTPFKVFTPYKRAWFGCSSEIPPLLPPITSLRSPDSPQFMLNSSIPRWVRTNGVGGESEATIRLNQFVKAKMSEYRRTRDMLAIDGTSRLSPHIAHGTISPRQVYWRVRVSLSSDSLHADDGAGTFLGELVWREFYYQVLSNFPGVLDKEFKREFQALRWNDDPGSFDAWCRGMTGFPLVDAAMRQLNAEGWMHNRARMIVASFLTKDLHIDWRLGEQYFRVHLIDADVASNNGGWQWAAGTGTDAAPYFRIFNPAAQSKRYDPDGEYIRKYVPELRSVAAPAIHQPGASSLSYPLPLVDHAVEREVALTMYRKGGKK